MNRKPKLLITGANGFIGKHILRSIEERDNFEVIAPSTQKGFDIRHKKDVMDLPQCDLVMHLAGIANVPRSWECPSEVLDTNIIGTSNLLEYCQKHNAALIFSGSYVYGIPQRLPIAEDHPTSAENPYGVSKLAAEQLCYVFAKKTGISVTVLRSFNVYGPGQSESMVIPQMISQILKEGKIEIFDGKPKRDFIYIDDVVNAFVRSAEKEGGGYRVYNVGSGESHSIREIAETIVDISKLDADIVDLGKERVNEIQEVKADISKINSELGWSPEVNIREGLTYTYQSYANKEAR